MNPTLTTYPDATCTNGNAVIVDGTCHQFVASYDNHNDDHVHSYNDKYYASRAPM